MVDVPAAVHRCSSLTRWLMCSCCSSSGSSSWFHDGAVGPCTQVHGQGCLPPLGRGRGGGDAGSLTPRRSATRIHCMQLCGMDRHVIQAQRPNHHHHTHHHYTTPHHTTQHNTTQHNTTQHNNNNTGFKTHSFQVCR